MGAQTSQIRCDVVIVGGGLAGLTAGLRLAQSGLKVVVLEKGGEEHYPCNSRITTGLFHCCGLPLDSDFGLLEAAVIERTAGLARPDLISSVTLDGMRVIGWLRANGVSIKRGVGGHEFAHELQPPALSSHGYDWHDRAGDAMLHVLERGLVEAGGLLLRDHPATELRRESGRITGCRGERSDGQPFTVEAAFTVLATGGFEADLEHVRQYVSPHPEALFPRHAGSGSGDAMRMARMAGAATSSLGGFYGHVMSRSSFGNPALQPFPYLDAVLEAGLIVDEQGHRFADEGLGGTFVANAMARLDNPLGAVVIADAAIWNGPGRSQGRPHSAPNPRIAEAGGEVHEHDTLEALAEACGLPAGALLATVAAHNRAVAGQATAKLEPPRTTAVRAAMPIVRAPFYALPACAAITYTMDGVASNGESQALDLNGRPLNGLYVIGCAAGGLEGGPSVAYVSGMLKSCITALHAADHIAELAREGAPVPVRRM